MSYEINPNALFAVSDERDFQNHKWGTIEEHPHEVGGYLTLMRKLLADADTAWATERGDVGALHEIRKLVAVGIACMEQNGPIARDPWDAKDIRRVKYGRRVINDKLATKLW